VQTPRSRGTEAVFFRKQESAEKNGNSRSNFKRLSMAKSDQNFFKEKKEKKEKIPNFAELRIPKSRPRQQQSVKVIESESMALLYGDEKPEENISNMLYERALEESIEGFQRILAKVEAAAREEGSGDFGQYRQKIYSAIFDK
jgi:hypothetical protein